ncbi:UDP-glycosyltransferase [Salinimicrobium sp. WS361]|uniref:UDP-glycosyltransferase n=1 Tax=Salinimicrobium sp. WS361 TaxID=3425123 RepID=UPI003D6E5EBB
MGEIKKSILVVAESINVEDSSGSKANVALIKNLQKAGFNIKVYHYTRSEIQMSGVDCVAITENRKSLLFLLSRLSNLGRKYLSFDLNRVFEKYSGFSLAHLNDRNSIVRGLRNIEDFKPDLVLTLSKGASFRPHHALLRIPEFHSKWVAYIHDPYPMHSYPRPYDWVEPGHQQKRKFFLQVAEKALYAAYPSKLLAEWMESYYPPLKGKRVIVPHQIVEGKIDTSELPDFFKQEAFTIVHAGALMSARNPMGLIKAFGMFLKVVPEAASNSQLLFLGPKSIYANKFEKIKEELSQFYSSDDNLPFAQVHAIQYSAAVNVILEAKGPISPFLPGKFPHCIQAGKPILLLGPYYSESRRLLGDDYPWWSEIDDVEKISEIIGGLYQTWKASKCEAGYNYENLNKYLSIDYLSDQLLRL